MFYILATLCFLAFINRPNFNSYLGSFNYWVFQWFFLRVLKAVDTDTGKITGWGIEFFTVPLTGWDGVPYKYLGKRKQWIPIRIRPTSF